MDCVQSVTCIGNQKFSKPHYLFLAPSQICLLLQMLCLTLLRPFVHYVFLHPQWYISARTLDPHYGLVLALASCHILFPKQSALPFLPLSSIFRCKKILLQAIASSNRLAGSGARHARSSRQCTCGIGLISKQLVPENLHEPM